MQFKCGNLLAHSLNFEIFLFARNGIGMGTGGADDFRKGVGEGRGAVKRIRGIVPGQDGIRADG